MSNTDTKTTVSQVANVIVPVDDQDAMLAFYTETLGLEKRADVPFGDEAGYRWIEVAPSGAQTPIALCPPGPNSTAGGKDTGITLQVDDVDSYYAPAARRRRRRRRRGQPVRRPRAADVLVPRPRGQQPDGRRGQLRWRRGSRSPSSSRSTGSWRPPAASRTSSTPAGRSSSSAATTATSSSSRRRRQADGLLIGRRTYESFAGAWPKREGEFADKFNSMPKFVVSTTLSDPDWNNTTVLGSGDAAAQVRQLKEEFDGELQVPGSHQLVQELIENDLVDQVNLMVFPVILGTGKKAFEETPERRNLKLKSSDGRRRRRPRRHLRARLSSRRTAAPPRELTLAGLARL